MAQLPIYQRANVQVAQPGGSKGSTGLMAEAQAKSSLSQRLSSFSEQITGISKGMAQTQAAKDAVIDVYNRKQKIADINAEYTSRDITEDEHNERVNRISAITEGAEKNFLGVYSKAYNNAATAAYSNQVTMDTKMASDLAMLESEGNSDWYQTQMKAFREETIRTAPTKETGIIAELAINQYGSQGYKALKTAEIREEEARRKRSSFDTIKLQSSDVVANIQEGDWASATTNLFKLRESNNDAVKNGWKDKDQAQYELDKATEQGILDYAKDRFATGQLLDGQEFIDNFRKGGKDSEIPTEFFEVDRNKVANRMEYLLEVEQKNADLKAKADAVTTKEEANIIVADGIKIFNNRKLPSNIDEIKAVLPYASLAKQHEYQVTLDANEILRPFNKLSLPEQQSIINSKVAEKTASRTDIDALNMAKTILRERAIKAKEDPMSMSFQEGFNQQSFVLNPNADLGEQSQGFLSRGSMQNKNKEEYGNGATALLTKTEVEAYSQWFSSPTTTVDDKLNFLEMVEGTIPGKSNSVYNQLIKKGSNVVAYAGSLIKEGGRDTAYKMLKGQEVMKAVDNPQDIADLKDFTLKALGNTTQNLGGSETGGALDAILDSVVALYYGDIQEKGKLDKGVGGSQLKKMITEATGGTHKRNDQSFFLPRGATKNDFDEWVDELDVDAIKPAMGMTKEQTVRFIQDNRLNSYGPGEYSVYQGKSTLKNLDGSTYTIKYRR